ncbi:restriction endonuclease subunit S [Grimontia hollisae]|uniref:restriction endonuclease subunit S n=1 Tax=Grimontia hollisae TaxID=673 RepID=UPI0013036AAE|nr:restriction endonuclease subunit S [Grimontia hollisae]
MSQLPKGWVETNLDKIAKWGSGGTPKRNEPSYYGGDIPWVKTGDLGPKLLKEASEYISRLGLDNSSAKLFPKGSVAIAMYGATIGKTSILDFDTSTNQACAVGSPIDGLTSTEFLYYFLTSEKQNFIKKGKGGAQPNISQQLIKAHSVMLPPLAEQTRIVEKLDEVLAQVDTIKARLDGIPAILKRFRQSVLAAAVSGKLTEEWRGNAEYSDSKNQLVPSTWEVRAAKDICVKVQSGSTPRNDPFNQNGTIPFLKVYNIVNQKIDFDYKPQFITSETHSETLKRSVAYPGDVLMNIVGPPLGKVAILTDQYPEWNLNQAITLFRANEEILLNKYLYFVLCEGELVRAVMPETKGSVGQVNISLSQCRDSLIPLPPLEEQKEIVRLVDQYFAFADTIEAQVKKAQARVDKLTQSILAKAFRGELVPQDPNDEPADKLLERIAAARKEAEALAKAAKKAGRKRAKA